MQPTTLPFLWPAVFVPIHAHNYCNATSFKLRLVWTQHARALVPVEAWRDMHKADTRCSSKVFRHTRSVGMPCQGRRVAGQHSRGVDSGRQACGGRAAGSREEHAPPCAWCCGQEGAPSCRKMCPCTVRVCVCVCVCARAIVIPSWKFLYLESPAARGTAFAVALAPSAVVSGPPLVLNDPSLSSAAQAMKSCDSPAEWQMGIVCVCVCVCICVCV